MVTQTFPRSARIVDSSEFGQVRKEGRSYAGRFLFLNVLRVPPVPPSGASVGATGRLGVITSRKVGGAVERNRVRRYVREVFRKERTRLEGFWLVVVARRSAGEATFDGIFRDWVNLGRKAGLPG
jgi:ribonuclease P protein component